MSLFNRKNEVSEAGNNIQTVKLQQLLSSVVVATADAGYAASRRFYDNLCEYAFVKSESDDSCYAGARTLDFEYVDSDGNKKLLCVPILSLLPLPMLQVQDVDFTLDAQIADFEMDGTVLNIPQEDESEDNQEGMPSMRVTLLPTTMKTTEQGGGKITSSPSLNIHISMGQSDIPGGMARLLQTINNLDFKQNKPLH